MSYYKLSEAQEFAIEETRNALRCVMVLCDSVPSDKQITLNPSEVSALLSILQERLPTAEQMPYHPCLTESLETA